jgi:hypothetical protein
MGLRIRDLLPKARPKPGNQPPRYHRSNQLPKKKRAVESQLLDTVVIYTFPSPEALSSWDQVDLNFDADLLFRASVFYCREVERVPLLWPWMADRALNGLETTLNAELDYIELKEDARLSLAFLNTLADKGILPSADFVPYYDESVAAAGAWISTGIVPLTHTPMPPSALLLGSGLLGLGLLGWRRTRS